MKLLGMKPPSFLKDDGPRRPKRRLLMYVDVNITQTK